MTGDRNNIIESAVKNILEENAALISISGDFGTGKSFIAGEILNSLDKYGRPDHFFTCINFNANSIIEFAAHLSASIEPKPEQGKHYNFVETYYNLKRSTEILSALLSAHEDTYVRSKNTIRIKENFEFITNKQEDVSLQELEIYLESAADRRLIADSGIMVIESLIVDLINLFYPGKDLDELYNLKEEKKYSVVYLFDEFDHFMLNIKDFIEELIKYCREIPFSKYKAYEINSDSESFGIYDLIDINFIVCSRKDHQIYKKDRIDYKLENLSKNEFDDILEQDKSKDKKDIDKMFEITKGNPLMMKKYYHNIKTGKLDEEEYYTSIFSELFKYSSEVEKDLYKSTAYLNNFEINGIKCFSLLRPHAEELINYLEYDNNLTKENEQFNLSENIKNILRSGLKILQKPLTEELTKISIVYEDVKYLIADFNDSEFDALRTLAYFKKFDINSIEKSFQEDAAIVFPLVERKSELFDKHKHTKALNHEVKLKLDAFNKYRDLGKYDKKKEMVEKIWLAHEAALKQRIKDYQEELKRIDTDLDEINESNSELSDLLSKVNADVLEQEQELIQIKKILEGYREPKEVGIISAVFTIGVLLVLGGFFIDSIYANFMNSIPPEYLGLGLLSSGLVFLLLISRSIYRLIKYNSNVDKIKAFNNERKEIQNKRSHIVDDANRLKADINANMSKVQELEQDIINYNKHISDSKEMLLEPYSD